MSFLGEVLPRGSLGPGFVGCVVEVAYAGVNNCRLAAAWGAQRGSVGLALVCETQRLTVPKDLFYIFRVRQLARQGVWFEAETRAKECHDENVVVAGSILYIRIPSNGIETCSILRRGNERAGQCHAVVPR